MRGVTSFETRKWATESLEQGPVSATRLPIRRMNKVRRIPSRMVIKRDDSPNKLPSPIRSVPAHSLRSRNTDQDGLLITALLQLYYSLQRIGIENASNPTV